MTKGSLNIRLDAPNGSPTGPKKESFVTHGRGPWLDPEGTRGGIGERPYRALRIK